MNNKEFLSHVGVLGMHWGRRKAHSTTSSSVKSKKASDETDSDDHKKKTILKKKKIREMSNTELRSINERLQLERQYKELNPSEISKGKKFVSDILTGAAKQTLSTLVVKGMTKGIDALLKKDMK